MSTLHYTYDIVEFEKDKYQLNVKILDGDKELLDSKIFAIISDDLLTEELDTYEKVAADYIERVYLKDLRKNFKKLKSLVLPSDEVI